MAIFKPLACAAQRLHLHALQQQCYFALLLLGRESRPFKRSLNGFGAV